MQLLYTPNSHFARKVRMIAAGLEVKLQLVDVGNVANLSGNQLELNPLMKVPTLLHGDAVIFDSDVICAYLVHQYDPEDRFGVLTQDINWLNARTVMNGVMSAEVELILAARTGLDITKASRFHKYRQTIVSGLAWLESGFSHCFQSPCNDYHLVCMWDHLEFFSHCLPAQPFPQLRSRVASARGIPHVAASSISTAGLVPAQATL